MRFKKIKTTKEGKTHLEYEVDNAKGGKDEVSFTCADEARLEFRTALSDLAKDVLEMCELPEDYLNRIVVTGVSFSYGGEAEVMGCTLIGQLKLLKSNVNLNLITPHKIEEFYSENGGDEAQLLDGDCVDRISTLIEEAENYVNGVRAQGNLFSEKMRA